MTAHPANAGPIRQAVARRRLEAARNGVLIRVDLDELQPAAIALSGPGVTLELQPPFNADDTGVTIIARGLAPTTIREVLEAAGLRSWGALAP